MSTITIYPENENQINLLKALLKELKISFEIEKEEGLTEWQRKNCWKESRRQTLEILLLKMRLKKR